MERRPRCCSDGGVHRQTDAVVADRSGRPDAETKPVTNVEISCPSNAGLGDRLCFCSVDIDIEASTDAEFPSEKSSSTLDNPVVVDHIEAFEKPVVGHLPLELLECPRRCLCCVCELVRKGPSERRWGRVAVVGTHDAFDRFASSRWVRASAIQLPALGSLIRSRNHRRSPSPSSLRRPNLAAWDAS